MSLKITVIFFVLLSTVYGINNTTITTARSPRDDENNYIINNHENLLLLNIVEEHLQYCALLESIQHFIETVLTLKKYYTINISKSDIETLYIFIFDNVKYADLKKVKDFWEHEVEMNGLFQSRPEISNHILLKHDDVYRFVQLNFARCKHILTKVRTKEQYYRVLSIFGEHDYPSIICICIYCFDAIKFDSDHFVREIFSRIIFARIQKEQFYFGRNSIRPVGFEDVFH